MPFSGGSSGGADVAGDLDFIVEALDCWEHGKVSEWINWRKDAQLLWWS